jgi:hypothetical protein
MKNNLFIKWILFSCLHLFLWFGSGYLSDKFVATGKSNNNELMLTTGVLVGHFGRILSEPSKTVLMFFDSKFWPETLTSILALTNSACWGFLIAVLVSKIKISRISRSSKLD